MHTERRAVHCIALVACHIRDRYRGGVIAVVQRRGDQHGPMTGSIRRSAVDAAVDIHRHIGMRLGHAFYRGMALVGQAVVGGKSGVTRSTQGSGTGIGRDRINGDGRHWRRSADVASRVNHGQRRNVAAVGQCIGHCKGPMPVGCRSHVVAMTVQRDRHFDSIGLGQTRQDGVGIAADTVACGTGIVHHIRAQHIDRQSQASRVGCRVQREAQMAHRRSGTVQGETLACIHVVCPLRRYRQRAAPGDLVAAEFQYRAGHHRTHIDAGDIGDMVGSGGCHRGYTGVGVQRQGRRNRRIQAEREMEDVADRCHESVASVEQAGLHGNGAGMGRKAVCSHPGGTCVHRILQLRARVQTGHSEARIVGHLVGAIAAGIVLQADDHRRSRRRLRGHHLGRLGGLENSAVCLRCVRDSAGGFGIATVDCLQGVHTAKVQLSGCIGQDVGRQSSNGNAAQQCITTQGGNLGSGLLVGQGVGQVCTHRRVVGGQVISGSQSQGQLDGGLGLRHRHALALQCNNQRGHRA